MTDLPLRPIRVTNSAPQMSVLGTVGDETPAASPTPETGGITDRGPLSLARDMTVHSPLGRDANWMTVLGKLAESAYSPWEYVDLVFRDRATERGVSEDTERSDSAGLSTTGSDTARSTAEPVVEAVSQRQPAPASSEETDGATTTPAVSGDGETGPEATGGRTEAGPAAAKEGVEPTVSAAGSRSLPVAVTLKPAEEGGVGSGPSIVYRQPTEDPASTRAADAGATVPERVEPSERGVAHSGPEPDTGAGTTPERGGPPNASGADVPDSALSDSVGKTHVQRLVERRQSIGREPGEAVGTGAGRPPGRASGPAGDALPELSPRRFGPGFGAVSDQAARNRGPGSGGETFGPERGRSRRGEPAVGGDEQPTDRTDRVDDPGERPDRNQGVTDTTAAPAVLDESTTGKAHERVPAPSEFTYLSQPPTGGSEPGDPTGDTRPPAGATGSSASAGPGTGQIPGPTAQDTDSQEGSTAGGAVDSGAPTRLPETGQTTAPAPFTYLSDTPGVPRQPVVSRPTEGRSLTRGDQRTRGEQRVRTDSDRQPPAEPMGSPVSLTPRRIDRSTRGTQPAQGHTGSQPAERPESSEQPAATPAGPRVDRPRLQPRRIASRIIAPEESEGSPFGGDRESVRAAASAGEADDSPSTPRLSTRLPVAVPADSDGETLITVGESDGTVPKAEHTTMPPLTLEATGTTRTSGTEQREPTTSSAPEREPSEDSSAPEPTQGDSASDPGSEFSPAPRTSATRSTSPRDGSREQPGERPPDGRETAQLYPDLTVKTLAPTVDVTHREQRRDITHRSEPDRQSAGATRGGLEELVSGDGPERSKYPSDVDRIVEKLYREIERKSRIERERRGL